MIEFILKSTLFLNGIFLSRVGVSYIQSPRKEIHINSYKNEVLDGRGLDMLDILGELILDYMLKFIYSEKATKFCEIFTLLLTGTTEDKSKVKILQNFVAFSEYRTRAIISCGLYFFYPIFTSAAAYITDSLCTKNGNSSIFKPKIRGL